MSLTDLPCVKHVKSLPDDELIKVLFVNPNSTQAMTNACLKMLAGHVAPDTVVYGYTAPVGRAPNVIEGHLDGIQSTIAVMEDAYELITQVDCVLVGCFSDHPLIKSVREEFDDVVCMGIVEAAVYSSRIIGSKFGVLASIYKSQLRDEETIAGLGMSTFCVGLLSSGIKTVSDLVKVEEAELHKAMSKTALTLVEEYHADTIVLGCAGMSDLKDAVQNALQEKGYEIPIIDGVVCGINMISAVYRSGLHTTSKQGAYSSAKEARELRGDVVGIKR
ncbi:unnamed protein product [Kluyveromyces dobzhanskii CBS 2104]|uniref:WGS project CCBQ000000000 data, contig 00012 n=1 Tax=Kluyveromyces dobzhanskii CBS 2104 TaxID=1427455 RepID=A0A0A8L0T4_9SACH|nr:unnamed protein product [Kluyveromyces dobzhanskii CBS 2104]